MTASQTICLFSHNAVEFFQAVTLHTDLGDIKLELFCEQVPRACEVHFLKDLNMSRFVRKAETYRHDCCADEQHSGPSSIFEKWYGHLTA